MKNLSERSIVLLLMTLFLGVSGREAFAEKAASEQELLRPFEQACKGTLIPPKVALAIARHESGLNPFAVNVAGIGHMPNSREEALQIIRRAEAAGKSFDVGLMQINNQWFSKLDLTVESLLDPTINIATGVKILNMEFEKHGKNWNAVGYYHSPNSHRGLNYSWRIYQLYHDQTRPGEIPGLQERIYAEQKTEGDHIPHRTGIWRNPNSGQARGVKSFQVRGQGIIRLSGAESGASASQAGTAQN